MDSFTFRNISGRCGRMFHHFSGDVWLFGRRPPEILPEVDIPVLSQTEETPTSLLQHVDIEDLSDHAKERLEPIQAQRELSEDTLRANVGLDLQGQIALAAKLRSAPHRWHPYLSFDGCPSRQQLTIACQLIWEHFGRANIASAFTRTHRQLAYQLRNFGMKASPRALIAEAVAEAPSPDIDVLVKDVCGFVRNIAGFAFPVRLRALERIQREVFMRAGLRPGDYSQYISRVESLFLDTPLVALDEYGVPPELALKLRSQLRPDGDLDAVLARLSLIDPTRLTLTEFEQEMLAYAQAGL